MKKTFLPYYSIFKTLFLELLPNALETSTINEEISNCEYEKEAFSVKVESKNYNIQFDSIKKIYFHR